MSAPDGWVQVVPGPRLPAAEWPQAEPFAGISCCQCHCRRFVVGECDFVVGRGRPTCPATAGGFEGFEKIQATVLPIQDRIKACKAYLERARKRLAGADAVIARVLEQKSIFDGEVADGEKRLQELQLEEVQGPVFAPKPKVAELRQQIDDLVREKELLRASQSRTPGEQLGQWCANVPLCVKEVPSIPQDYTDFGRMDHRTELRSQNPLEFGNAGTITQIGTVVARFERCCDGRAVKVIVDGVDRRVRRQAKVGARWRNSSCVPFHVGEPSVRVHSVWVDPLQSMQVHHRQCEGFPTVTKDSRYG